MKKTVIILAGGLSSRFSDLGDKPKCMLNIYDIPILHRLINHFDSEKFNVLLSLGYLSEEITNYFSQTNIRIKDKVEPNLLGTAGAIKYASEDINSENFIVINGDTINNYSKIEKAFKFHKKNRNKITQIVSKNSNQNKDKIIVKNDLVIENYENYENFDKKLIRGKNSFSSTGAYIINKKYFDGLFTSADIGKKISLETSILPKQTKDKKVSAYEIKSDTWDLGTVDRYKSFLKKYKISDIKKLGLDIKL